MTRIVGSPYVGFALGVLLTGLPMSCGPRNVEALDPATLPEGLRADYAVFAARCSKCHALARPLNAGITDDQQWELYVSRMRRQPGSGISPEDQTAVLRFLKHHAAELREKKAKGAGPSPLPSVKEPAITTPARSGTPAPPLPVPHPSNMAAPPAVAPPVARDGGHE